MEFEKFRERLMKDIPAELSADVGPITAEKNDVAKLQDEGYQGIVIRQEGHQVGVTLDANRLYDQMENGSNYGEVLDNAIGIVEKGLQNCPEVSVTELMNYDAMKEKLSIQVVATERNAEMLENIPHKDIEDMSLVCRFVLSNDEHGAATVLVNNGMMSGYGITSEQLFQDAMKYAPEIRPSEIISMRDIMIQMMGPEMADMMGPADNELPMYVASSVDRNNGAGVIAYPRFMEQAAEKLGGDFFVLPSSVHEVILVPDNGEHDYHTLENMVKEVNETQVEPSERLSDSVYHYDSKEKVFERADKFDARKRVKESELEGKVSEKGSVMKELGNKQKELANKPRVKPEKMPGKSEVVI